MSFGSRSLLDRWKHSAKAELLIGGHGVKLGYFPARPNPFPELPILCALSGIDHHFKINTLLLLLEGLQPGYLKHKACHFKSSTTGLSSWEGFVDNILKEGETEAVYWTSLVAEQLYED